MSEGAVRQTIANEIVKLHSRYYGQGPTRSRTYMWDDLVVVALEETFTPAERTLIEHGETDAIEAIRRKFQRVMKDQFVAIVEQTTGRQVRAFMSEVHLEADISVEIFMLGDSLTDMGQMEEGER